MNIEQPVNLEIIEEEPQELSNMWAECMARKREKEKARARERARETSLFKKFLTRLLGN